MCYTVDRNGPREKGKEARPLSSPQVDELLQVKHPLVIAGIAVALFAIIYQIFISPIIGLADNGDFWYACAPFKIDVKDRGDPHRFFHFVVEDYQVYQERHRQVSLMTTEHLNVGAAVLLWHLVSKDGTFDIRLIGAIHATIVVFALFLILPILGRLGGWRAWIMAALCLAVILDASYLTYYNSFYADAASLVFLLLLVATYLRIALTAGPVGVLRGTVLVLTMLLFLLSKSQRAPLGFTLLLLLVLERKRLFSGRRRFLVAMTVVGASTLASLALIPADYRAMASYNVIFAELLPRSEQPSAVLEELGLPVKYVTYAGSNAFSPQSAFGKPASKAEFVALASHWKLLGYYLHHPASLSRLIEFGATQATEFRPWGFGNFTQDNKHIPGEQSRSFALWTELKRFFVYQRPYRYLATVLICCTLLVWCAMKSGQFLPDMVTLSGMTGMEFGLAALADVGEPTRHLFIFNALVDLQLLCLVAFVLWKPQLFGFRMRRQGSQQSAWRVPVPARTTNLPIVRKRTRS